MQRIGAFFYWWYLIGATVLFAVSTFYFQDSERHWRLMGDTAVCALIAIAAKPEEK